MDSAMLHSEPERTGTSGATMQDESTDDTAVAILNIEDGVHHLAPEAIVEAIPGTSRGMPPSMKKPKLDNGNPKSTPTPSSVHPLNLNLVKMSKVNLAALFKACQPKRRPKVRRGRKQRPSTKKGVPELEATTTKAIPQPPTNETTNQPQPLLMPKTDTIQHVEVKVKVPVRRAQRKSCISPDITTPPPKKTQKPRKASAHQSASTFEEFKVAIMAYIQDMRTNCRQSMTVASLTERAKGVSARIGYDFKTLPEDWIQDLQIQYSDDFTNFGIDHLAMPAPAPSTVRESRKRK